MISEQLRVFRSPHALRSSESLPRGTKSTTSIIREFLPAAVAIYEGYGASKIPPRGPKWVEIGAMKQSIYYLFFSRVKRSDFIAALLGRATRVHAGMALTSDRLLGPPQYPFVTFLHTPLAALRNSRKTRNIAPRGRF